MDKREEAVRLWFEMWLKKTDMGISDIFDENVIYTESWGPEYHGAEKVRLWFDECISRQDVLVWDIRQFFHNKDQTVVEWYFKYQNLNEAEKAFEGVSLIKWTYDNKIISLQEFACSEHRYDPYKNGTTPVFEDVL